MRRIDVIAMMVLITLFYLIGIGIDKWIEEAEVSFIPLSMIESGDW